MTALTTTSPRPRQDALALARGLGWFSIALGMTELFATRGLARWLGISGSERVLKTYGLREIGNGIGILASDKPDAWMWGRVLGDGLDLATLAPHLDRSNEKRPNLALFMAAVLGITVADVICAQSLSSQTARRRQVQRRVQRRAARDYSARSGFRRPPEAMRGAARDFKVPDDFRTPTLLRPWGTD